MFADGFIAEHIFEILGLLVTVGGVWLVVKQLNETRLASQMEGMLALTERNAALLDHIDIFSKFVNTDKWKKADGQAARKIIFDSKKNRNAFLELGSFYEIVGVLVGRKVLDENLAYDYFGDFLSTRWTLVEKAVKGQREQINNETYLNHWEWLAKKFEAETAKRNS